MQSCNLATFIVIKKQEETAFETQEAVLEGFEALGFVVQVSSSSLYHFSMDDIWSFIQDVQSERDYLAYDIDGIVIKGCNSLAIQEGLVLP